MSIADKLTQLTTIMGEIRSALADKGISASEHDFADFASDIGDVFTIPSAYQRVEYIESTGTQYINSAAKLSTNTRILAKESMNYNADVFKVTGFMEQNGLLIGSACYGQTKFNQGHLSVVFLTKSPIGDSDWIQTSVATDGTPTIIDMSSGSQKVNGSEVGTQTISSDFTPNNTIYLFARHAMDGTANPMINEKIYSYKIYENNTLIRDFIPCYRKSDNVIGLWDNVNGVFYTNQGSGTFLKGADI